MLGPRADVLLGAGLDPGTLSDPVLDSQNRFYGVAFGLYGVLLWICAEDPLRHGRILRALLLVFAAGGLARCVSLVAVGLPSPLVLALLASELLLPMVLRVWLGRPEHPPADPSR